MNAVFEVQITQVFQHQEASVQNFLVGNWGHNIMDHYFSESEHIFVINAAIKIFS